MGYITIVGLGPGAPEQITKEAFRVLRSSSNIFIRTVKHPSVKRLLRGKQYESFDYCYEQANSFEKVYETITDILTKKAETENIVYAVPGHPCIGEAVTKLLRKHLLPEELKIIPGLSFIDVVLPLVNCDPVNGLIIIDALEIEKFQFPAQLPAVIMHLYSKEVASCVKLHLLETMDPESMITVIRAAGVKGKEETYTIPLYELDRQSYIDHLVTLFVPPPAAINTAFVSPTANGYWSRLISIMDTLREEGGCPWDREQTFKSLEPYLVEETYEVKRALEKESWEELPEELGDLLLQIVFLSRIAKEDKLFTINDVVDSIINKLIRRHPHVFKEKVEESASCGKVAGTIATSEEVVRNWEAIKKTEGKGERSSVMDGVPESLPALHQADLIQQRARGVGFDWPEKEGAIDKLKEELSELEHEIRNNSDFIEDELGDFFFALVNVARRLNIDSERALRKTIAKFKNRFNYMETKVNSANRQLSSYTLSELDLFWNEAKELEQKGRR